jgi:hypothetical protein
MGASEDPVTATWEEARPPHLPDRITAVPIRVWPFVGLAVLLAFLQFRRYGGMSGAGADVVALAPGVIEVAAMTLVGAALFLRHPDAWSRLRPVALGVTLLAVAEALRLLAPMVDGVVAATGITGEAGEGFPVFTVSYFVARAGTIVGILGVASLWLGFRAARRTADPTGTRGILTGLLVVGFGVLVIGYGRQIALGAFDGDGVVQVANAIVLVTIAVGLAAWVAVASVVLAGARVRERPVASWIVGAVAAVGMTICQVPILSIWPAMDATSGPYGVLIWTVMLASMGSAVLLLTAFFLGLPAPSEAEATAEAG